MPTARVASRFLYFAAKRRNTRSFFMPSGASCRRRALCVTHALRPLGFRAVRFRSGVKVALGAPARAWTRDAGFALRRQATPSILFQILRDPLDPFRNPRQPFGQQRVGLVGRQLDQAWGLGGMLGHLPPQA
jgi:hypothetical protein